MDTSKQYIKMCQEAHEIQELVESNNLKEGFFFRVQRHQRDVHHFANGIFIYGDIWLPRQDQLQEIAPFNDRDSFWEIVRAFYKHFYQLPNGKINSEVFALNSLEKQWLSFVMKEKYNKEWDFKTETWINAR